jgi:hypothetical protein
MYQSQPFRRKAILPSGLRLLPILCVFHPTSRSFAPLSIAFRSYRNAGTPWKPPQALNVALPTSPRVFA